ncbi:DapH/DapD/GlmU-related protein [Tepidiforma sp.]|uniref:serine O-acetyltransferase n=1 Tax=Tepidiforma sp. TaxID=2682230 RepID=UPI002ADE4955|nr:DapH/DapD/GlmU-related protein [Tepidiforma sp.]
MFENVREDIRQAVTWHAVPVVRRWLGPRAETVASILLSAEAQVVLVYRLQAWLRAHRVPLLPLLCRRLTMLLAGVSIGDRVRIGPGLLINHGHVVIDGTTTIGPYCSIAPFVTIGLNTGGPDASLDGPTIGRFVFIGTGAKILGPVRVGDNARIGANAVVLGDVPDNATAVGVPARVLPHASPLGPVARDGERADD